MLWSSLNSLNSHQFWRHARELHLLTQIFGIDFGFCVSIIIFLLNDGSDIQSDLL